MPKNGRRALRGRLTLRLFFGLPYRQMHFMKSPIVSGDFEGGLGASDKLMVKAGNGFHDLCGVRDLAVLLTNRWSSRREPTDVRRLQAHLGVGSKTRM